MTTTPSKTVKNFAVWQRGYGVLGVGRSERAAQRNAREFSDGPITFTDQPNISGGVYLVECSAALAREVRAHGGDVDGIAENSGGVLCLRAEWESE
jgi:hypothetical protein